MFVSRWRRMIRSSTTPKSCLMQALDMALAGRVGLLGVSVRPGLGVMRLAGHLVKDREGSVSVTVFDARGEPARQ